MLGLFFILLQLSFLLEFLALIIWGIYQFDKMFLNQLFFNYLNSKYSPPKELPKIGSIQKNIYDMLPSLERLKVTGKIKLSDNRDFLMIQLSSDISPEQQLELENIVRGIIANHEVPYTVDYSQIDLDNGGWFANLKLETIEEATFNKNARSTEPRPQGEFDDEEYFEL